MRNLKSNLVCIVIMLLFMLNTAAWGCFFFPVFFVKLIIPVRAVREFCSKLLIYCALGWIHCNSFIVKGSHSITWDVQGLEGLSVNKSYLVLSNHRSWADIFVLQHIFKHRIPFIKFFLKQELIWVPVLGAAWWALDFPFMKRYSTKYLEKHPELKGKDMQTIQEYCEMFKNTPVSVLNFVEGTRFDYVKQEEQNSPYRNLLYPRAGGAGIVLSSMGDYLSNVLDVTIFYPDNEPPVGFLELLKGNITRIVVRIRVLPVHQEMLGRDYFQDPEFKSMVHEWIHGIWQEKDELIQELKTKYTP